MIRWWSIGTSVIVVQLVEFCWQMRGGGGDSGGIRGGGEVGLL